MYRVSKKYHAEDDHKLTYMQKSWGVTFLTHHVALIKSVYKC